MQIVLVCARRRQADDHYRGTDTDILLPRLDLNGQNLLMNGLYDGEFVGFKIASSKELDAALREAVVAVDANVLLDLYRF